MWQYAAFVKHAQCFFSRAVWWGFFGLVLKRCSPRQHNLSYWLSPQSLPKCKEKKRETWEGEREKREMRDEWSKMKMNLTMQLYNTWSAYIRLYIFIIMRRGDSLIDNYEKLFPNSTVWLWKNWLHFFLQYVYL